MARKWGQVKACKAVPVWSGAAAIVGIGSVGRVGSVSYFEPEPISR